MPLKHGQGTVKKIKKGDDRYWFEIKYRGVRVRRCTEQTIEREAEAWAKEQLPGIKEEIDKRKNRRKVEVADLVALYEKSLSGFVPHRSLHVSATPTRPISDKYHESNVVYLERYVQFLKNQDVVYTFDITEEHVGEYNHLLRKKYGLGASYNCVLASLRHVHKVLGRKIVKNFWAAVDRVPRHIITSTQAKKQPFTMDELELLFMASESLIGTELAWIWFAIRAGFYTGFRLGDVLTLKWSEIDEEGFVSHADLKTGKKGLIFCPDLLPLLDSWERKTGEYILQYQAHTYLGKRQAFAKNRHGLKPKKIKADKTQATRQFMKWIQRLGIETRNEEGKTVKGFHSLRVSHATFNAAMGGSLEEIQERLKHSDSSTTEGYIQLDLEQKKRLLRTKYRKIEI